MSSSGQPTLLFADLIELAPDEKQPEKYGVDIQGVLDFSSFVSVGTTFATKLINLVKSREQEVFWDQKSVIVAFRVLDPTTLFIESKDLRPNSSLSPSVLFIYSVFFCVACVMKDLNVLKAHFASPISNRLNVVQLPEQINPQGLDLEYTSLFIQMKNYVNKIVIEQAKQRGRRRLFLDFWQDIRTKYSMTYSNALDLAER